MSVKRLGKLVFITFPGKIGNLVVSLSKILSVTIKPCKHNQAGHRMLIVIKGLPCHISLTGIFLLEDARKLNRWLRRYKNSLQ